MRFLWPLLLVSACTTHAAPPCAPATQPAARFACSQLPVCRYNCAVLVVNTEGGTAPQTVAPEVTQQRTGARASAVDAQPVPDKSD